MFATFLETAMIAVLSALHGKRHWIISVNMLHFVNEQLSAGCILPLLFPSLTQKHEVCYSSSLIIMVRAIQNALIFEGFLILKLFSS